MASWPRAIVPFEVTSLEMPGPLISKAQSGRVNLRATQQIGRTWTERYLVNVRSVNGRALLAFVDNVWRNGTTFTIDHRDHITPIGTGGGSPLIQASAQLVTDPENFGAWAANVGTPVKTAGQTDPLGGTGAYLINDDDGAAIEGISETVGFTGDATKAIALFVKQGSVAINHFGLHDLTAGVWRHQVRLTWTAGVPAPTTIAGGGTFYTVENWGGGWYRIPFTAASVVAANTNNIIFRPTDTTGALTGTAYLFGVNAWNELTPARYAGPSQVAGTTGTSLYVNSGTASVSNWLRAGDIISIAGLSAVYEVTADVSTQANGYAIIPINPPIFTGGGPADNAAVTITGVTLTGCILEPPTYPTTSSPSADYGELVCKFSESL